MNPFTNMGKKDYLIWAVSLLIILLSNLYTGEVDLLTLTAALTGVTSLIFAAKGNVWAQILMVLFSILYGVISFRFHYWGEMVTYLGMTLPMAVWSMITWLHNPSREHRGEVNIQKLNRKQWMAVILSTVFVTLIFYRILVFLDTPNLLFSTLSIATSFLAAALTMLRSSWYAFFYAANDVVLIVLWILAARVNPDYVPVIVNFVIFFFNDMYGFLCWKKREKRDS